MPRNDEGEFELVVGNRQLMALLFVLFSVCGVVFGIGYWIGKNASPEVQAQAATAKPSPSEAASVEGRPEPVGPPAETAPLPQAAADIPLPPGEAKMVTATGTTAVTPDAPQTPAETRPAPPPEARPSPPPAKPVETAKAAPPKPSPGPQPGERYLQIAAVKRAEAEIVAEAMNKRGFHTITAPATPDQPADGLWRVLVGPVGDNASIAKIRADLQAAGFKRVFVQKY